MYNNYLEDVIHFNSLDKKKKRQYIWYRLLELGITPQLQDFHSCFGEGRNIFADIGNKQKKVVLSAHYDGDSIFDNNGAIIALIELAEKLLHSELQYTYTILFTDQEETYQQGSSYFLKNQSINTIVKNINIDGFGIGDELYVVSDLIKNTNTDTDLFLTDRDEFSKYNIPSVSYFSAFKDDFLTAKDTGEVFETFRKYTKTFFFKDNFDFDYYSNSINELWKNVC